MSIDNFYNYLDSYAELYYSKYVMELDSVGDFFCNMSNDEELKYWLKEMKMLGAYTVYKKTNAPSPAIENIISEDKYEKYPAYSVALREFFLKDCNSYDDIIFEESEGRRVTELEEKLAKVCHAGRSTISSWKSGKRVPDKYKWWTLGIAMFELSYWHIQPYLDMIGAGVDMTCIDDVLLFYSLCTSKSAYETYMILDEYRCDDTKKLFVAI